MGTKTNDNRFLRESFLRNIAFVIMSAVAAIPLIMVFVQFLESLRLPYDQIDAMLQADNNLTYAAQYAQNDWHMLIMVLGELSAAVILFWLISRIVAHKKNSLKVAWVCLKRNKWAVFFLLLIIWAGIATAVSEQKSFAFFGDSYLFDGYSCYLCYGAIFCVALLVDSPKRRLILVRIFAACSIPIAFFLFCQEADFTPISHIFTTYRSVIFPQFNHLGYYLNLALLATSGLFFYEEKHSLKALWIVAFLVLLLALFVNNTFGCYIALCVTSIAIVVIYAIRNKSFKAWTLIPILLIVVVTAADLCGVNYAGALNGSGAYTAGGGTMAQNLGTFSGDVATVASGTGDVASVGTERGKLWTTALQWIPQSPIFGYGPEGANTAYLEAMDYTRPHNEYIQWAAFTGIPGLLFYLLGLILLAVATFKRLRKLDTAACVVVGCVITYLVSACFGVTIFSDAPFLWLFLGLTGAAVLHSQRDELPAVAADSLSSDADAAAPAGVPSEDVAPDVTDAPTIDATSADVADAAPTDSADEPPADPLS